MKLSRPEVTGVPDIMRGLFKSCLRSLLVPLTVSVLAREVSPGPGEGPVLTVVSAHHGVQVGPHPVVQIVASIGLGGRRGGKIVRIVRRWWRRMGVVIVRSCQPHHLGGVSLDNSVHQAPARSAVDGDKARSRIVLDWDQVGRGSLLTDIFRLKVFSLSPVLIPPGMKSPSPQNR